MSKIIINNYIDALLSLKLFTGFSREELLQQFNSSNYNVEQYGKGQVIHLQNEICHTMDIILEGLVSVQKIDENGNILKIEEFSNGETIGANLLFSKRNFYPMTVVGEAKTLVLHVYKSLILELCRMNFEFMTGLVEEISNRTLVLTDKIDIISHKTIRQRILDFLEYEYHIQKSDVIKLSISKKDLAERLGIQRTSLSRELQKMKKEGLLEYDARTITLKQR